MPVKRTIAWWIKLLLDLAWFLLLLVAVLIALASVLPANPEKADELEMNVRIELDPETYAITAGFDEASPARLEQANGKLRFQNPGGPVALAVRLWNVVSLIIVMIAVYQLRRIFASLSRKTPFDAENTRRVRVIGFAIIAGQFVGVLMALAFSATFENAFSAEGLIIQPDWGINPFGILFGLMVLAFSEVFRLGSEIKEDQDLTV